MSPIPVFPSVVDALAWWSGRDRAPLAAAVVPPCSILRDDVHDAMLAVYFKNLAGMDSTIARLGYLDAIGRRHEDNLAGLILTCPDAAHEPSLSRLRRMIAVIELWKDELVAGPSSIDGRSAA